MSDAVVRLYMEALIALFALCLGLLTVMTMADANVSAMVGRGMASLRLRSLRMNRMLAIRHIDRRLYLSLTPLFEVRRELSNCRHCPSQQLCDSQLARGEGYGAAYSYCPNTPFLDTLAARIRRLNQTATRA